MEQQHAADFWDRGRIWAALCGLPASDLLLLLSLSLVVFYTVWVLLLSHLLRRPIDAAACCSRRLCEFCSVHPTSALFPHFLGPPSPAHPPALPLADELGSPARAGLLSWLLFSNNGLPARH